jgi:hypothetical protein
MTELHDKIYWVINKFNREIEAGKKDARDCLDLLGYIRKICPDKDFPVWAERHSLTSDAYRAGFSF